MEIVPGPGAGRVCEQAIRPGIADATPSGRCRLDAIARWLQDIAYADLVDAGFEVAAPGSSAGPESGGGLSPLRREARAEDVLQRDRTLLGRAADIDPG